MAKIALCLILSAIILPNFISASFPGDGCCVRWRHHSTCCINREGFCCENLGSSERNDFPPPRHHHHRHDGRFNGDRGNFGRDRSDSDFNGGFSENREEFGKRPHNRHGNGWFDGNDREDAERNGRQGTERNNHGSSDLESERNNQDPSSERSGTNDHSSSGQQSGSTGGHRGGRRN